jgi:hypothetical protein
MSKNFILLTTTDNNPVIIGLSNIALIESNQLQSEESETIRTLNFARNKDLWPKTIHVNESFDQIKSMLSM